jgi:hypothetical protein
MAGALTGATSAGAEFGGGSDAICCLGAAGCGSAAAWFGN